MSPSCPFSGSAGAVDRQQTRDRLQVGSSGGIWPVTATRSPREGSPGGTWSSRFSDRSKRRTTGRASTWPAGSRRRCWRSCCSRRVASCRWIALVDGLWGEDVPESCAEDGADLRLPAPQAAADGADRDAVAWVPPRARRPHGRPARVRRAACAGAGGARGRPPGRGGLGSCDVRSRCGAVCRSRSSRSPLPGWRSHGSSSSSSPVSRSASMPSWPSDASRSSSPSSRHSSADIRSGSVREAS